MTKFNFIHRFSDHPFIEVTSLCGEHLRTGNSWWGPSPELTVHAEEIWSSIHAVLPSLRLTCDTVHCLRKRGLLHIHLEPVFFVQTLQKRHMIFAVDGFFFFKIIDVYYTVYIPKYELHYQLTVMLCKDNRCFIHYHIPRDQNVFACKI